MAAWAGGVLDWARAAWTDARGTLFPWVPVCLGTGIALWFALPDEPGYGVYAATGVVLLLAALSWRFGPEAAQPVCVALACIALGGLATGLRSHLIAAPVLEFRYYGPIQGRIVEIDRSQTDALRLTLDRVVLDRLPPERTPALVRLSLRGKKSWLAPQPGQVVQMTGHLAAPEGPVEPGGFDFRRMAWFRQLGAIGYTPHPVLLLTDPLPRDQWIGRLRAWFSRGIQARIGGDAGAFAAGVMTGDQSGLSLGAVQDLRASSLAHLLAISGMNLAFLIGFVFALVRTGIALVPPLALRVNAKKIAAVISLVVAWFYLLLSGANVATERAFLMVCVMLGAVLLDRRAITLRSVALSATALLLVRPESLLDPGFQMSFAATVALITGFTALERGILHGRVPRWIMPVFTLVLSSALAGAATAPFGAAHFGRIADFGFFANLLTVPVMGAVVMPAGAVAALLAPLGLADLPLWVMGLGCRWILYVAGLVAEWDGAVTAVPLPAPWVLPLLAFGGCGIAIWRGRGRWAGLVPIGVALLTWGQIDRPALLIAPDAGLVGVLGAEGRALSVSRGAGFAAASWLENDGDLADQAAASARSGFAGPKTGRRFAIGGWSAIHLRGKDAAAQLAAACARYDLVIAAIQTSRPVTGCRVIDQGLLDRTGGLAVHPEGEVLRLTAANTGHRLWSGATPAVTALPPLRKAARQVAGDQ